jgi:hypothetical protein
MLGRTQHMTWRKFSVEEHNMHWLEAWLRTSTSRFRPQSLRDAAGHRSRGSIITEEAVLIGVVATLGLATVVAFVNGLGGVFTKALGQINGQVP